MGTNHDIARMKIKMGDTPVMNLGECSGQALCNIHQLRNLESPSQPGARQIAAPEIFHDHFI
nr:hypothetical protein [Wenzhouxiangella limi]